MHFFAGGKSFFLVALWTISIHEGCCLRALPSPARLIPAPISITRSKDSSGHFHAASIFRQPSICHGHRRSPVISPIALSDHCGLPLETKQTPETQMKQASESRSGRIEPFKSHRPFWKTRRFLSLMSIMTAIGVMLAFTQQSAFAFAAATATGAVNSARPAAAAAVQDSTLGSALRGMWSKFLLKWQLYSTIPVIAGLLNWATNNLAVKVRGSR